MIFSKSIYHLKCYHPTIATPNPNPCTGLYARTSQTFPYHRPPFPNPDPNPTNFICIVFLSLQPPPHTHTLVSPTLDCCETRDRRRFFFFFVPSVISSQRKPASTAIKTGRGHIFPVSMSWWNNCATNRIFTHNGKQFISQKTNEN